MIAAYSNLVINELTGNLREDVHYFLTMNGCQQTAEHSMKVGEEAKQIAEMFGADPLEAEHAGYLHDISAVFPNEQRVTISQQLGLEVLPEEEVFPMIIHQKLSKEMARSLFNISNPAILNAVGCHTTLRKHASLLDMVLFVADKIAWDQPGTPPYLQEIRQELEKSVEHACYSYIRYLWQKRESLRVIHPWLKEAYYELEVRLHVDESIIHVKRNT
ncbi:bis(5'-nucleosyl)-tetraphosphatase (symmetrical) YqeK [Brevibacillus centrosporus]|uniref:bis(5'-nucleosyl)-tetraphosphatase (symmetrical) YqeK n=1 Tax=Brevibacillus centrosporus TaxID=54910 RepID=UPI002E20FCB3|nr:bis(5'-nucleosyl)-tetraphosphatase (symmetrical) YqeK [Brevibacillus centrosporus]